MTLEIRRRFRQLINKLARLMFRNTGNQASHVLYTKHSVEKRIQIQITAMNNLNSSVLSVRSKP